MRIIRRKTRKIKVGSVFIGGDAPISIQSMTTTDTCDIKATVEQIKKIEKLGCQIIRVAVLDSGAAMAIGAIKKKINIPLVADIHFDYRLALSAIKNGADKIRLNPGNIQKKSQIEAVLKLALEKKVPIRIGLNSGSVPRSKSGGVVSDMIKAALSYERLFKKFKFNDTIFSFKTHDVLSTIEAYRKFAALSNAPLHLGLTSAGPENEGIIKSSIALSCLLLDGIGDTLRVSLTADPAKEIEAAKRILSAIGILNEGIEIISCPTCGRCTIDLLDIVNNAQMSLKPFNKRFPNRKLKVAIMGCIVNGPGEAKEADIGIAWGGKRGILFKKGKKIKLIKKRELLRTLVSEVKNAVV